MFQDVFKRVMKSGRRAPVHRFAALGEQLAVAKRMCLIVPNLFGLELIAVRWM